MDYARTGTPVLVPPRPLKVKKSLRRFGSKERNVGTSGADGICMTVVKEVV
jgi:hypothetical protein